MVSCVYLSLSLCMCMWLSFTLQSRVILKDHKRPLKCIYLDLKKNISHLQLNYFFQDITQYFDMSSSRFLYQSLPYIIMCLFMLNILTKLLCRCGFLNVTALDLCHINGGDYLQKNLLQNISSCELTKSNTRALNFSRWK